jgi:hypothetical protein
LPSGPCGGPDQFPGAREQAGTATSFLSAVTARLCSRPNGCRRLLRAVAMGRRARRPHSGAAARRALTAMTATTIAFDSTTSRATVQDLLRERADLPPGHPARAGLRARGIEAGLPMARRLAAH